MSEECKVAVVGAGISGLCAAHLLSRRLGSEAILVLEASGYAGGTMRTERFDGFQCDWGPNGFLDKEPRTLEWVEELGMADRAVKAAEASAHRFILKNDRLVEIQAPPKFFFTPLLSPLGRARLLREPFVKAKRDNTPESIWDFAARRIGAEAADTLVGTMVSGVFGGDAKQLSLQHCFPRMAEMEREHGSLVRAMFARRGKGGGPSGPGGTLTSFDTGIGALAERAAETLGGQLRLGNAIAEIEKVGAGYRLKSQTGEQVRAESVVLALPAHAGAVLSRKLDSGLSKALDAIPYAPIAVVCTAYRREKVAHDLNGFGFLVPRNQKKRTLGCLWTSTLFPRSVPEGWVLLRTLYGGYTDPGAARLEDKELLELLGREVHPLLGIEREPEMHRIFRHERGIPQYMLNHGDILDQLEAAETRNPGLVLAGNAYRGVGLNDCVLSAHRAVERLC